MLNSWSYWKGYLPFFLGLFWQTKHIYKKMNVKMSIQYLVQWFKLTTFWKSVSSYNHQTMARMFHHSCDFTAVRYHFWLIVFKNHFNIILKNWIFSPFNASAHHCGPPVLANDQFEGLSVDETSVHQLNYWHFQDDISKFLPEGFKLEDTTSSTTESSTSLLADILSSIEKKDKSVGGSERGSTGSSTGSRLGGFRPYGGPVNRPFKSKSSEHESSSATTESSKSQSVNPLSGVRVS